MKQPVSFFSSFSDFSSSSTLAGSSSKPLLSHSLHSLARSKKGMELTVTVLVMLVISILLFSTGLVALNKIYAGSKDIETILDQNTESQLRSLLTKGVVALPENSKTVRRGQHVNYWIGIKNVAGKPLELGVQVAFASAFDESEAPIQGVSPQYISDHWFFAEGVEGPFPLENNEQTFKDIFIKADGKISDATTTPKGTYFFNVCVFDASTRDRLLRCDDSLTQGGNELYPPRKVYKLILHVV